ncbi:MAG: hypothetical protein HUJ80_00200 [Firmicutes bacterium]|nr:hypothetical protein [Bacillota bacterium]
MKRFTCIVLCLVLLLSATVPTLAMTPHKVIEKDTIKSLPGIFYGDSLKEVGEKSDLDTSLIIHSLRLGNSQININASIIHAGQNYRIEAIGKLYKSVISDTTVVGIFNTSKDFSIDSFIIEFSPQTELLLKTTAKDYLKLTRTNPVIKIAIRQIATEDIFYFEDIINEPCSLATVNVDHLPVAEEDSTLENALYHNERWFLYFKAKDFTPTEASSEDISNMSTIFDLLELNKQRIQVGKSQAKTVSPFEPIDASLFKREGTSQMTSDNLIGWYMTTVEYPVNSGNYLSSLTEWTYLTPDTVYKNSLNAFNFRILASGEYFYRAADDVIFQWSSYATYRLGDTKVAASLKTARGDVFTYYQYTQQYNSSEYTDTANQILGLFKRTATLGGILSILDTLIPHQVSANADSFPDTLAACEAIYGTEDGQPKTVVYLGISMPGNKKLYMANDRLLMSAIWKKPSDVSHYYSYVSGSKTIEIAYQYSVYDGSNAVLSNRTKVHSRTYY